MKNYKYIFSLSIILAGFASCDDEDNELNNVVLPSAPSVNVTATINTTNAFAAIGSDLNFDITVPQGFSDDAIIQVDSKSPAIITSTQVRLEDGATTGSGTITALDVDAGIGYEPQSVQLAASGVRLVTIEGEGDDETITPVANDNTALSSEPITIDIYDRIEESNPAGMLVLIDWLNPNVNDFDAEIIDEGFTGSFGSSGTGSRYEVMGFGNGNPDGNYDIYLTVFSSDITNPATTEDVPTRIFFTGPDGVTTIVEVVVPAGTVSNGRFPVARYTKTTVGGVAEYSNFIAL
ncbi:hypothetical protein [uncultured Aquimarina sp.]|uniref:hypothetical protein n=1 Tax=uncultured Aquimarina sp. TaxID=575652 RepID=UPI0026145FF5|nr:hypothetical protein [uncultured Aquimarina sp.]